MNSYRMPLILIAAALIAAILFSVLVRSVRADEGLWQTNFKAALAKAKKEKKYVLVDFTGSDWCHWCIKLHNEVFDKEPFTTDAPKQYVLVELDFPQQKPQPEELKKQNEDLRDKYEIGGFPTVLLLDPAGEVIARTGYREGGPEKYLAQLAEFPRIYAAVAAAKNKLAAAQGLDRAKLLDQIVEGYSKLGNENKETTKQVMDWSKEIIALDPDNKAGLRLKYEFPMLLNDAEELVKAGKPADAKVTLDKALALPGISAEMRQEGLMDKAGIFESEGKFIEVIDALKAAKEAAPHGPAVTHIEELIQHFHKLAEAEEAVRKLEAELPKTAGLDRAKLLDKIVAAKEKLPENPATAEAIDKWSKEIIALDADNKLGLKAKYQFREAVGKAVELANTDKTEEAGAALDKALAMPGVGGGELQKGLLFKAQIAHAKNRPEEELGNLKKALAAAPDSEIAPQLKQMIQRAEKGQKGE